MTDPHAMERDATTHRRLQHQSLLMHAMIVGKIGADPAVLDRARARVAQWIADGGPCHPYWAERWRILLATDTREICAALMRDDEYMRSMRQSSPFAGALSEDERQAAMDAARHSDIPPDG